MIDVQLVFVLCGLITLALAIWGACHLAWWLACRGVPALFRACSRSRLRDLALAPRCLAARRQPVRVPPDGRPLDDWELAAFGRVMRAWAQPAAQAPQAAPAPAWQDDDDGGGPL